jgi:hypothetical protein
VLNILKKTMNLFIAIPCYGGNISNLTFHSLFNIIKPLNDMGHNLTIRTLPTESLISRGRNKFVTMFLDDKKFNGTHLLFIDSDIGFTLENLLRVIEFNREVVTCTYPVKGFYWQQLLDRIKENTDIDEQTMRDYLLQFNVNLYPNTEFKDGFARVKESATGFMMIKREVFTTIMDKNPQLKYKPDLRTGIEGSDNAYDFFPVGIYKEKDGVNRFLSEDYYFCRLWEECGGEIWTDLNTSITHLGNCEYHGKMWDQLNRK